MLRLAKAFLDIALWRKSPAQLPASAFLLSLVAAAVAALEVLGALLPPNPSDRILTRVGTERRCAAVIRVGGARHRASRPALPADRYRVARRGGDRATRALSVGLAAELHRHGSAGFDSLGVTAVRRPHLVLACLREHLARRTRFEACSGRGDQRGLPLAVDCIGAAAAAQHLCTCISLE